MATTENPVGIEARAPMLAALDGPAALRELSHEQLTHLAEEIRTVVIDTVDRNGGHLGSNLGAVELTIALHRAFDSPRDLLLFDTGHQTYPHKLLTGRLPRFDSLRTPGGLSGYPAREESEHDLVENSHASTILSWAHGLATARRLRGDEGHVVAVIGDGSLTGGMAWEGLNNLGASGTDCLVIVNDNGRSYAPTVSRLGEGLARSDTGAELFGCLGLTYLGSVDGHDLHALDAALRVATTRRGPRVLHVRTEKGRGHQPALDDPIKRMHDTSVTRPDSYTASFGRAIVELGAADPRVVALPAAMPDSTGLLEFAEQFPDRCFDVGIAEQHAVTMAAGLAMGGLVPVVAIYSTFLTRALDQVVYDVGLHDLGVIFCLDRAGITGDDGASHHGVLDLALLSRIPGMTILTPSCLADLPEMLRYAHQVATAPNPGPVAIRWSKTVPTTGTVRSLGTSPARVVREGSAVCLVADDHALTANMERMLRRLRPELAPAASKRILEINPEHPLVQAMEKRLAQDRNDPRLEQHARLLYDQAVILEGSKVKDPLAFARRLNDPLLGSVSA
ncbi:MAG TPA: 1-deoxy-D-xylulose-5-phosphate synthase, partial [Acidimicrobiales bacterium]|nr:1-deoxy-D-xylulose-5-phosphate synthase [Acidimicrobiales bacterium]